MKSDTSAGFPNRRQTLFLVLLVVLAAALLLPASNSGIWNPWEMDRAHLARRMTGDLKVLVVEPDSGLSTALSRELEGEVFLHSLSSEAEQAASQPSKADEKRKPRYTISKQLENLLDNEVFHVAVLRDQVLLQSPEKGMALLESIQRDHPGMSMLLTADDQAGCEKLVTSLQAADVANAVELLDTGFLLKDKAETGTLVERYQGKYPFVIQSPCLPAGDLQELVKGIRAHEGDQWTRLAYHAATVPAGEKAKDHSTATFAMPPLDYWLTGLAYKTFGFSEFSSRIPFIIMGILTLLVLGLAAGRLFGARVALTSVAILLATPMFIGQAKNMAGEISYTLFLTLGVLGYAGILKQGPRWTAIASLVLAAAGLFLAKGLFGLTCLTLIMVAEVAILKDWSRRALVPTIASALALGLLALLVLFPNEWTFFSHFKFMNHPFNGGPTTYAAYFDYFIRQVGFASFPWVMLLPLALGSLVLGAMGKSEGPEEARPEARMDMLVFLWFMVPFVLHSAGILDFKHLVFPAIPALAVAIARFWEKERAGEQPDRFPLLLVAGIAAVILQGLLKTQEPLVNWLTTDPKLAGSGDKGAVDPGLPLVIKGMSVLLFALAFNFYFRSSQVAALVAGFFRKGLVLTISIWVVLVAFAGKTIGTLFARFDTLKAGQGISRALKDTAIEVVYLRVDILHLWIALGLVALVALLMNTRLGEWLARPFRFLGGLPGIRSLVPRLARVAGLLCPRRHPLPWMLAGLGLSVWALINMLVTFPADQTGLLSGLWTASSLALLPLPLLLGAGLGAWFNPTARLKGAALGLIPAAALICLNLAGRIFAFTDGSTWDAPLLIAGGSLISVMPLAAASGKYPRRVNLAAFLLFAWALVQALVPLLSAWAQVEAVKAGQGDPLVRYLFLTSRTTLALYAAALLLAGNRLLIVITPALKRLQARLPRRLSNPMALVTALETPRGFHATMLAAALAFAAVYGLVFLPGMAREVSQKHIIDLYKQLEGRTDLGEDIFKYKTEAGAADDKNFYTAGIPAMTSQQDAMDLLTGDQDQLFLVQRSASDRGSPTLVVRAWADENDANRDGVRDYQADAVVPLEVTATSITVEAGRWTPGQWKGFEIYDWKNQSAQILDNDDHTLTFQGNLSIVPANVNQALVRLDNPAAANHQATAMAPDRTYLIMDHDAFSQLNYKFRQKMETLMRNRGVSEDVPPPHIPVLEGENKAFLLAASKLLEGETNHNRFAMNSVSTQEFDAMTDVNRGLINFDDKLHLIGYRMKSKDLSRGSKFEIDIFFKCTGKLNQSYKIFMHLDAAESGNRINGDHWPLNLTNDPENKECVGCWKTSNWMPGDIIVDHFETEVPLGTPGGTQYINLGFYLPGSGKRLPVKDKPINFHHYGDDRIRLGTFEVH